MTKNTGEVKISILTLQGVSKNETIKKLIMYSEQILCYFELNL